ncbi:MAG: M48 family metallopeptidase [Actinomycetota bacterium]|nr:M48 family metallopeptidase [Actinomycetota bacterium]
MRDHSHDTPLPGFGPHSQSERLPEAAPVPAAVTVPDPVTAPDPFVVEVFRSARRKRTVGAQLQGGVLKVSVPSWMSRAEVDQWTEKMAASFRRKQSADRIDLQTRAVTLARRYRLPRPTHIRWADDMVSRWGSCTPTTGHIRISNRLASFPDWVVDYVIVHELAHLEVHGHGADFWQLANRYPKAERAIGYLIAKAGDSDALD